MCNVTGPDERISIYSMDGTPPVCGGGGHYSGGICFARRNSVDTVLLCDGSRVVEIDGRTGHFMRRFSLPHCENSFHHGITYSHHADIIATALVFDDTVLLLAYDTGTVIRRIAVGTYNINRSGPRSVAFAPDGVHAFVIDARIGAGGRLCKFEVATGDLVSHTAILTTATYCDPSEVLVMADGSVVVLCCAANGSGFAVICTEGDCTVWKVLGGIEEDRRSKFGSAALSALGAVRVKMTDTSDGTCQFHDICHSEWYDSLRCAWVSACVSRLE